MKRREFIILLGGVLLAGGALLATASIAQSAAKITEFVNVSCSSCARFWI